LPIAFADKWTFVSEFVLLELAVALYLEEVFVSLVEDFPSSELAKTASVGDLMSLLSLFFIVGKKCERTFCIGVFGCDPMESGRTVPQIFEYP
jgi:hypothetical protein